jgi:fibronectin-binding autotransporter adhesin
MKTLVSRGGKNILAMAAMAVACTAAVGATKTYEGTNNGTYAAGPWSPAGVPAAGDDVTLGNFRPAGFTGNMTVTLNTSTANLNSFNVNSSALPATLFLEQILGTLTATTENIGLTISDNVFDQNNSTLNSVGTLNIAVVGANNVYNLNGAGAELDAGVMNLGISGDGIFNQNNGNAFIGETIFGFTGGMELAQNALSSGAYNMSNGNLTVETLGFGGGNGTFTQTGGNIAVGTLDVSAVGSSPPPSGNAIFNDSGGTLTNFNDPTTPIIVGNNGNGTFNLLTGGILTSNVELFSQGIFDMNGGSIAGGANILMLGGIFEVQGNNTAVTSLTIDSGTFQNGATSGTLTLNLPLIGGVVNTEPAGVIMKDGATGNFGLTIAGGAFALTTANTYSGNTTIQAGLLQALANNTLSPSSPVILTGGTLDLGTFTETIPSLAGTGGTVNIGGSLTTGTNNLSSSYAGALTGSGTFSKIGAGTLTLAGGGSFTGTINVQGGITVGALNGIPSNAILNLGLSSGASLNVNANQSLAVFSTGTVPITTFANNATLTVDTANIDTTIDAAFFGTGTFVKAGTGNLTLGFGSSDTSANTDTTLTIVVNSGNLLLNKASATTVIAGPLTINGGSVLLNSSNQIAATSAVTLTGGTLNLNSFNETFAGLSGSGGSILLGTGNLAIAQNTISTYAGAFTGSGNITKSGNANLTLSGTNTGFTGGITVSTGNLTLQGPLSASSYSIAGGATLLFSNAIASLGSGALQPSAGGAVQYSNATINGGFLRGPGTHTILAGGTSTFNGTTTFNSTILTQNGPAILNDFTNGGTLNNNATLTLSGFVNAPTGVMNINTAVTVQDFDNEGVLNIPTGASITNSLSNMVLAGGSRTFIGTNAAPGGSITLQNSTTIEVNGALLVNDGTIAGTTDVNYGGTAEGVGTYGPVNVTFGGVFQPGISSTSIIAGNNTSITALSGDGTIDNVAAAGNITLNVNTNIANSFTGTIQNSNGALGLNLNGGSLTLFTHPIAGGNSINTYTGGTTITSGSLIIGATGAFPAGTPVFNNGSFFIYANSTTGQITGNGQLTIGSVATGNAVATIAPKSGLSTLASLTITPGSKLDLTNNDLIIHTGSFAQIVSQLAQGYSQGTWAGSTGIASSVAALNANHAITLGVATGLTMFDGQSVLASDFLIKYTWLGDANLDGVVNSADLTAISSAGTTWQTGDFNYDSKVNADDYALYMLGAAHGSSTNISATLPEPAIGVICAGGLLVCSGRRRRI